MLSCSIWSSAPSFWMGGGSRFRKQRLTAVGTRCANHMTPLYPQKLALTLPTGGGRSVGMVRSRTKATEFSLVLGGLENHCVGLKTTTHPKTRCRKPYAANQYLMLLMMGVCTRNMSS